MNAVFLDTVGMIAVWDDSDQWHAPAQAAYRRLLAQGRSLVTTTLVLYECANAAARRPYRRDVSDLRDFLSQERLSVEPTAADLDHSWTAYDRGEAAQAGIVDHVSFTVMRRLGLTDAFTNDRHFQAAGFQVLF